MDVVSAGRKRPAHTFCESPFPIIDRCTQKEDRRVRMGVICPLVGVVCTETLLPREH